VGQRRGLGIAAGEALYVIKLDPKANQVVVGPYEALATRTIQLRNVNWLGAVPLTEISADGVPVEVRVRSTRPPQPARLSVVDGEAVVTLSAGEHGVSPGQACVFYADGSDGAEVLGGGWIVAAMPARSAA
jgi:tRNA-specific 2-thiouridylase